MPQSVEDTVKKCMCQVWVLFIKLDGWYFSRLTFLLNSLVQ
jgi:hypothetical protein